MEAAGIEGALQGIENRESEREGIERYPTIDPTERRLGVGFADYPVPTERRSDPWVAGGPRAAGGIAETRSGGATPRLVEED